MYDSTHCARRPLMARGVKLVAEPWEWVRMKTCCTCGETKPWAKFSPVKRWLDGSVQRVDAYCHECRVKRQVVRQQVTQKWRDPKVRAYKNRWQNQRRAELRAERGRVEVQAAPLCDWLHARVAGGEELSVIADRAGTTDRTLRRILTQQRVSVDLADRILLAHGVLFNELYPVEQASA